MSNDAIGKPERETQNRIIDLFKSELGYAYLGNWEERETNTNIEESLLRARLTNTTSLSNFRTNQRISSHE